MNKSTVRIVTLVLALSALCFADTIQFELDHAQGEMAGELKYKKAK